MIPLASLEIILQKYQGAEAGGIVRILLLDLWSEMIVAGS